MSNYFRCPQWLFPYLHPLHKYFAVHIAVESSSVMIVGNLSSPEILQRWVTWAERGLHIDSVLRCTQMKTILQFQGSKDGSGQMQTPTSVGLMGSIEEGWRCKQSESSEHEMFCMQSQSHGPSTVICEEEAFMQRE